MKKFGKKKNDNGITATERSGSPAAGKKGGKGAQTATKIKQALQDTAIEYIKAGNIEALEKMTEDGCDEIKFLNRLHTKSGKSSLGVAAEEGRIGSMSILLKAKPDVDLVDKLGMTAFLYAAKNGEFEILEMLFEAEVDLHVKTTSKNENALALAVAGNHFKCVELLESYTLAIDEKNKMEETPLSTALKFEYFPICSFLVEREANINVRGVNGNTPLLRTAFDGHEVTAQFIIENHGDVNLANNNGETALMIACKHSHAGVINLLLKNGAMVNAVDLSGRSALMLCCMLGKHDLVALLVEHGADINQRDLWGYSSFMHSCVRNVSSLTEQQMEAHMNHLDFLLERGAVVDQMDRNYNTPLMHCCKKGNMRLAARLLEKGANYMIHNIDGVAVCDLITDEIDREEFVAATKVVGDLAGVSEGTQPIPSWMVELNDRRRNKK